MYSLVTSGAVIGVSSYLLQVETDISDGLPSFSMVGFVSDQVREAGERVRVALKNAGFHLPPSRVTVNFSPANIQKRGMVIDLPVAIGVLTCMGVIPQKSMEGLMVLGELGLNGEVRPVRGVLPIVEQACREGIRTCVLPLDNAREGAVVSGIRIIGVRSLLETIAYLKTAEEYRDTVLPPLRIDCGRILASGGQGEYPDFGEVHGQEGVKRVLEIAAAGFHNVLMIGPPGSGKSMMARCLPGILPPLSLEESLEISRLYSVAGLLEHDLPLVTKRPFISPHHSITLQALSGGGSYPMPGAITLAHRGVLFMDELPEFRKEALNALRQPMEDHRILISRAAGTVEFPARFMLIAAANPCPCGKYPLPACTCTRPEIEHYQRRIPGPILDRFDLSVDAPQVTLGKLMSADREESSQLIRERVLAARERQKMRFSEEVISFNADMSVPQVEKYCPLEDVQKRFMVSVFQELNLSARAYHRVLKTARTIADLEDCSEIREEHLAEAVGYRLSSLMDQETEGGKHGWNV